jgi:hypothetical protein
VAALGKDGEENGGFSFYSGIGLGLGKPQQSSTSMPCLGVRGVNHMARKLGHGRGASPSERRWHLGSGRSLGLQEVGAPVGLGRPRLRPREAGLLGWIGPGEGQVAERAW